MSIWCFFVGHDWKGPTSTQWCNNCSARKESKDCPEWAKENPNYKTLYHAEYSRSNRQSEELLELESKVIKYEQKLALAKELLLTYQLNKLCWCNKGYLGHSEHCNNTKKLFEELKKERMINENFPTQYRSKV